MYHILADLIQKHLEILIVTLKREVHAAVYAFPLFHVFVKYL